MVPHTVPVASALPGATRHAPSRRAPSFARTALRHARRPRPLEWIAVAVLLIALGLQLLFAQRETLAADPAWRPLASAACKAAGCTLPPWHEPTAWTMLARSVQPAPGVPQALEVQASFRNDAHWPQPWPVLVLSLSDIDSRTVAQGAFAPADYLDDPSAIAAALAPGQAAQVRFLVREPDTATVAFGFDFR